MQLQRQYKFLPDRLSRQKVNFFWTQPGKKLNAFQNIQRREEGCWVFFLFFVPEYQHEGNSCCCGSNYTDSPFFLDRTLPLPDDFIKYRNIFIGEIVSPDHTRGRKNQKQSCYFIFRGPFGSMITEPLF